MDDAALTLAFQAVGLAGRELGSGPFAAVERLVDIDQVEAALPWVAEREVELLKISDEDLDRMRKERRTRAETISYGIAVGLVACDDAEATASLMAIHGEWLRANHD